MDLPEIRQNLIQFLNRNDLATAAAVCKSWNSTFSAELYKEVMFYGFSSSRTPSKEAFRANAGYIQTIHFLGNLTVDFPCEGITQLKEIHAGETTWGYISWDHLYVLLYRNPRVHSIILNFKDVMYIQPKIILDALLYCQDLRHLKLPHLTIERREIKDFLRLCTRLESLHIKEPSFTRARALYNWTQPFFTMKELIFDINTEGSSGLLNIQLELIRRCPQLTTLKLAMERERDRRLIPRVCEILSTDCLFLNQLSISTSSFQLTDNELAQIFGSCHNLSTFVIPAVSFYMSAFEALRQHFESLTKLDLLSCPKATSRMVHDILVYCPQMIILKVGFLDAHHILGTTKDFKVENGSGLESALYPINWVCLNLQEFVVVIRGLEDRSPEWHRHIFHQLGRLKKLKSLAVGPTTAWSASRLDGLDFRLESGLKNLGGLTQLKKIEFNRLKQQMSEQDIRWMIQSWPLLELISGRLHFQRRQRQALEDIIDDEERYIDRIDCANYSDLSEDEDENNSDLSEDEDENDDENAEANGEDITNNIL
ncbi:hypothetical protein BGZ46_002061 [Entomortierella lignicola]|nr:hypothetical protein BGZ46_002061 [Entomortierella lignicola]